MTSLCKKRADQRHDPSLDCNVGRTAIDIIVHDGDVVEDLGERRDVRCAIAVDIFPRGNWGRCGEEELLANVGLAELLEERQEVGGVVRCHHITANALAAGIFPAGVGVNFMSLLSM